MSTTLKASVHLGPNYDQYLEGYRNTYFEDLKNLFATTQRVILEHAAEILNVSTTGWKVASWTRSTLMHNQVIKWAKAKVHVFPDSVLCLEKMQERSGTNKKWTVNSDNFNSPILTENCLGLMDRLSSSGIFSCLLGWSS